MLGRIIRFIIRKSIAILPTSYLQYAHRLIGQHLKTEDLTKATLTNIRDRLNRNKPKDSLVFLFTIDTALYPLESSFAVLYGEGVHTKHRHMQYHDFFTQRIQADEHVLDIGCGIGALAYAIADKAGANVVGIDYNQSNIDMAKNRFQTEKTTYLVQDIYDFHPDEAFNVVVMSNVLEHLEDRSQLLQRIQEQTQATRFLIRVPRFDRHWSVPLKKEIGVEWRLDDDHEIEFTPETFQQEMTEAHLEVVHIEYRWDEIWAELRVQPPRT